MGRWVKAGKSEVKTDAMEGEASKHCCNQFCQKVRGEQNVGESKGCGKGKGVPLGCFNDRIVLCAMLVEVTVQDSSLWLSWFCLCLCPLSLLLSFSRSLVVGPKVVFAGVAVACLLVGGLCGVGVLLL